MRETARMMAMNPYPGYEGKYFSMPCRNVVPKPVQRPHPPLWVACSNRDTIKLAARLGIGALTFAFIDPDEAKYWVDEYYETFKNECTPIGRAVNPNIAMVTGFMCHEDSETAVAPGPRRASSSSATRSRTSTSPARTCRRARTSGRSSRARRRSRRCRPAASATPTRCATNLETFENVGVDQAIFIQQGGNNRHEDICSSLELFADRGAAGVQGSATTRAAQKKAEELAPYIEKAMAKIPPLERRARVEPIESYPVLMSRLGVDISQLPQNAGTWGRPSTRSRTLLPGLPSTDPRPPPPRLIPEAPAPRTLPRGRRPRRRQLRPIFSIWSRIQHRRSAEVVAERRRTLVDIPRPRDRAVDKTVRRRSGTVFVEGSNGA